MKKLVLLFGASYGLLSVIFGAFGAHALKKVLPETALQSFETGVRYQMYHGILLLLIGFFFSFETKLENYMAWSFIVGTILFSFSIYLLALNNQWGYPLRFLGPVTPLGGLFLIIGWLLLIVSIYKNI